MINGVPTLKELYQGIVIDFSTAENRHLVQSNLTNKYKFELVELNDTELQEELDEEFENEFEDDDEFDEECDEEEEEECEKPLSSCRSCKEYSCSRNDSYLDEDEGVFPELVIIDLHYGVRVNIADITDEPFCRFLNQINAYNEL